MRELIAVLAIVVGGLCVSGQSVRADIVPPNSPAHFSTTQTGGRHHFKGDPTAVCTPTNLAVGDQETITGAGYVPGTHYAVDILWPAGDGEAATAVLALDDGSILLYTYAYFVGTSTVTVSDEVTNQVLGTCSFTAA